MNKTESRCPTCGQLHPNLQRLTRVQSEVLEFIRWFIEETGDSPAFSEIADSFSYRSLATVHEHIKNIERRGWITTVHYEPRSIHVVTFKGWPA